MKKVYGVYSGSIYEGGGVASPLYFDKDKAIEACVKLYKKNQREDRESHKYFMAKEQDEQSKNYQIHHSVKYKWRKHKKYDDYWTNTSDCIILQEFDIV